MGPCVEGGLQSCSRTPSSGPILGDHTADLRNPASPYMDIDVLYFQEPSTFGVGGLFKVMQDFYHQQ